MHGYACELALPRHCVSTYPTRYSTSHSFKRSYGTPKLIEILSGLFVLIAIYSAPFVPTVDEQLARIFVIMQSQITKT